MNGQRSTTSTKNSEPYLAQGLVDAGQQRRFTRNVNLVKKAFELEDGGTCLYRSAPGITSEVVNPADETEQLIWRSYVWSRRFVVCIAGMTPAGVEPSLRAAASKGDQKFRYQLGARFADSVQQRRSAVLEQDLELNLMHQRQPNKRSGTATCGAVDSSL